MLACAGSLCTKNFPERKATDTYNRKPVNSAICLHGGMPRMWPISKNLPKLKALAGRQGNSEFVGVKNPAWYLQTCTPPQALCASNREGPVDRGGRASENDATRGTLWPVATWARLKRNAPRPKSHRQRKTAQGKGRRRHRRYQARVRSLKVSASSPGQGQGRRR